MLAERRAIVTGGARGIGFAIANELVSQGAQVVICSRTKEQVDDAVKELSKSGKAFGTTADVSNFEDCQKLIDFALKKLGKIDILINNAGTYGAVGLIEDVDIKKWGSALLVNVIGAANCIKLAVPYMKKNGGGKIINLAGAGIGGSNVLPRMSAYFASKGGIVALTESLAAEFKIENTNIQINAIAPGAVASDLNMDLLKLDKSVLGEEMHQMLTKLKEEGGTPLDLTARLILFLISKDADHISGRLLSAKWDPIERLEQEKELGPNKYRLRRVDNELILEKK